MRNLLRTCSLLLLSATALAQTAIAPPAPLTARSKALQALDVKVTNLQVWPGLTLSSGCPVNLSASRLPGSNIRQVAAGDETGVVRRGSIGFRVTFLPFPMAGLPIAQARLTFHGTAGGALLLTGAEAKGQASEEFSINPQQSGREFLHSTVYTHKLTGVQWIELNEITYSDGTTWQESEKGACRFVPNGFMLVAAGQ